MKTYTFHHVPYTVRHEHHTTLSEYKNSYPYPYPLKHIVRSLNKHHTQRTIHIHIPSAMHLPHWSQERGAVCTNSPPKVTSRYCIQAVNTSMPVNDMGMGMGKGYR